MSIVCIFFTYFLFHQYSFAVCVNQGTNEFGVIQILCDTNPPNPDLVGVQEAGNDENFTINVIGGIDTRATPDSTAIVTGGGGTEVFITGSKNEPAFVLGDDKAIDLGECIPPDSFDDAVLANNSIITANNIAINVLCGGEVSAPIGISDSTVTAPSAIVAGPVDNQVIIEDSVINGDIFTDSGNDTVELFGNTAINGIIDGGSIFDNINAASTSLNNVSSKAIGFDTLIFGLEVPASQFDDTVEAINNLPKGDGVVGSIKINGNIYVYANFEQIVADITPITPRPIPTLSEWALMAMAGVLGIIGILAIRRRRVAA